MNFAARIILFITLPATVGLIILRQEIIEVFFTWRFNASVNGADRLGTTFFAIGLSAYFDGEDHCAGILRITGHSHACAELRWLRCFSISR